MELKLRTPIPVQECPEIARKEDLMDIFNKLLPASQIVHGEVILRARRGVIITITLNTLYTEDLSRNKFHIRVCRQSDSAPDYTLYEDSVRSFMDFKIDKIWERIHSFLERYV